MTATTEPNSAKYNARLSTPIGMLASAYSRRPGQPGPAAVRTTARSRAAISSRGARERRRGHGSILRSRPAGRFPRERRLLLPHAGDPGRRCGVIRADLLARQALRHDSIPLPGALMIEVRGLTKQYGAVRAVDDLTFDVAAGQGDRLPRAERRGQVDHDAHGARPRPADRRHARWWAAGRSGRWPSRCAAAGALLDAGPCTAGAAAATTCGSPPARTASRCAGSTRSSTRSGSAPRPGGG